ncbi:MAG: hypothetical protein JXN63_00665 [Candidatus Delongbacteria bacterium]|nr:hypothetical protein [Candidatus Delongbacteria bacterium]
MLKKLSTLINFSIRSGVAVIGQNRLEMTKFKDLGLVLLNSEVSRNTEKNLSAKIEPGKMIRLNDGFDIGKMTGRDGIKVMGFANSELQREIARLIKTHEGTAQ